MELFTIDQGWQLLVSAAITSVLVSAATTVFTKLEGGKLQTVVALIALVVTVLRTTFISEAPLTTTAEIVAFIQTVVLSMLITWGFAVLFWFILGKKYVDRLFANVWDAIVRKLPVPPTDEKNP